METLNFGILGTLEVRQAGRVLALGGHRQRAVLAVLIIEADRVVSVDRLIDAVWEEQAPATAKGTLQTYIARLRRVLQAAAPTAAPVVHTEGTGYRLTARPEAIDARRFERLAGEGRAAFAAGDSETAAALFSDALALWRGPALADFAFDDFAAAEAARLEELRLSVTEDRIDAALALGWHAALVGELDQLVAMHPLRERLRCQLMLALYRAGRQAEALRAYQAGRRLLAEELGIEPGPALKGLETRILLQEAGLDWAPAALRPGPGPFPPLATSESPPHNLPATLTSFVGRGQEVTAIAKSLNSERLVTIVGPGGVGKTRLALRVAAELAASHEDGTWFVDLSPQTDPDHVAGAAAASLGISEQPGRPMVDTVVAQLRARRLLLVLDNCEHVLDGCVALLDTLLPAAPGVRVLATSRERLRIQGEVAWTAPPLSTPAPDEVHSMADLEAYEATRLFLDRALSADPHVGLADRDAPTIASICDRLDGLPLAIELAAARVVLLTPGEILDHLVDRFRLLRSGRSGATARHATLRTALDWSYDLLDEDERTLLRRLAVFAGSFTLTAAAAVGAGPLLKEDDVFDLVDSLVSKSLVVREHTATESRFRLLETVRCYAAERLEQAGDGLDATGRHLDFYLTVAEHLEPETFGATPEPALTRLEVEHANLRAALHRIVSDPAERRRALRLAHALFPLWEFRDHRAEGRAALEALLAGPGTDDALESALSRRAGNLALSDGDAPSAQRHWRHALDLARRAGDDRHLGRALISAGRAARSLGNFDEARALLAEGHTVAERAGDDLFVDDALIRLAWLAYEQSRYVEARSCAEQCRNRDRGGWLNATRAFDILGCVARDQGDYAEARRCFDQAAEISRAVGDQYCHAEALDGIGSVAAALGHWDDARLAWEEAVILLRQGPRLVVVGPLGGLAVIASRAGDHDTARAFLEEELAAAGGTNDPADVARTLLRLGHAAGAEGHHAAATSRFSELLELAQRIGMPWSVAGALDGLAVSRPPDEESVTMAATAEAIRTSIGAVAPLADREALDQWRSATRKHLGARRFDAAWKGGQRADARTTVAAALSACAAV